MTKVSIVVPCYNQSKYIAEALDSLLAQTVDAWECIVVDDGSTDNSADIVRHYEEKSNCKIRLISQHNSGPSSARNHGASQARGKYLVFLDGDDKLEHDFIKEGVSYMDKHHDCALFYTKTKYFGAVKGTYHLRFTSYKSLLFYNSIVCTCIIRKTDFERVGGFDEQMHGYEDWEFFIRLLYKNDIVYQDPHTLFYYRKKNKENSVNAKAKARHEELVNYIYKKHQDKFVEFFGLPYNAYFNAYLYKNELDKLLASHAYQFGKKAIAPLRWLKKKIK